MIGGTDNVVWIGAGMALALTLMFLNSLYRKSRMRGKTNKPSESKTGKRA
jgi:hypothetical protein